MLNIGATEAIETELGITPSGVYADVRTRLDILEARINNPLIPAPNVLNPFFISGTGVIIQTGVGDPNIVLALHPPTFGSVFLRQDGSFSQALYVFATNGTWYPVSYGGVLGQAGGDLSGNYPNPVVDQAQGGKVLFDSVHGRGTFGGSGSDYLAVIGPWIGNETTSASIHLLPNATSPGATNYLARYTSGFTYFNDIGGNGLYFYSAGSAQIGFMGLSYWSVEDGALLLGGGTSPYVQSGTSATQLTIGTNKASAALYLQTGLAVNNLELSTNGTTINTATWYDYTGTSAFTQVVNVGAGEISWNTSSSYEFVWNVGTSQMFQNQNSWYIAGSVFWIYANNNGVGIGSSGVGTTAPITLDYAAPTTPFIQSGTSATSLTVGTNNSGATLYLQADAAATLVTLTAAQQWFGNSGQYYFSVLPSSGGVLYAVTGASFRVQNNSANWTTF